MQALPIIKPLDIVGSRHLSLALMRKLPMVHHLVLHFSELKKLFTGTLS